MTTDREAGDSGRVILHVDMDAFFASVELLDRPELRGLPMMVGGSVRGVVVSATYEARAHGVRSGMPVAQARRLSPTAVVIPPHHDRYREMSTAVFAIFDDVTHQVEAASVDEAFLDITATIRRVGSPATVGEQLRSRVATEHGITCTVGIAPTKLVAKMASSGSGGSGRPRPPDCTDSACGPSATWPTLRWTPCSTRSGPIRVNTCPIWPGGGTLARWWPGNGNAASAPRRPSPLTPMIAR